MNKMRRETAVLRAGEFVVQAEDSGRQRGAVGPIVVPFCMLTSCKYSAPLCPLGRLKAFTAINDDAR